ncbi:MAG: acetylglutamate kinase, partial [Muribaculaceae bacterium]|nr:acetylglutamate kinase [Muribaculaceae bacterium]
MLMINVVKIGGNVIDNPEALAAFLSNFSRLEGKKILVHGGGKEATRMGESMGIKANMIDGRRVTDRATLDIVTMVYAGLINKRIVAMLQGFGCNAVGLTGADGNVIPATRRPSEPIDYGFVGDIDPAKVNDRFIASLLEGGA